MQSQPGDINAYLADQNYNLGIEYLKIGDYLKAYQSLRSCLEAKPNNFDAWTKLGIACQNLGRYNEAITANDNAQAVISGNPIKAFIYEEAVELFNQAKKCYYAGDLEGAITLCEQGTQIQPNYAAAWYGKGTALRDLGCYSEALAAYDKALEIDPKSQDAWYNRGIALKNLECYEEALAAYDKALEINPNFYDAWSGRGNALFELGRYSEALTAFDKALKIDPKSPEPWYNRGVTLCYLKCYEEALAAYDKALEIDPKSQNAWYNRGSTLNDLERYSDSFAAYDKALEINPNFHDVWNAWGNALNCLERYMEALAAFDKALKIDSNDHLPWNGRGATLNHLERYSEAIAALDKALEINPKSEEAWNNRGIAIYKLGRYSEAIIAFDKALEITGDQYWRAWANRGWPFFLSGRYLEAIHNWDEGLKKYLPSNPDYRLACGQLHKLKGEAHYKHGKKTATYFEYFRKAKASYEQACKFLKSPVIPEAYLEVLQDLIIVCVSLEDFAEADEYLTTATILLENLLSGPNTDPLKKLQLKRKFAGIYQSVVDKLVRFDKWEEALQKAEERKNFCLKWMREGWQTQIDSPTFAQMQDLLNGDSTKAIIYWHLSPVSLTTFIITPANFQAISTPLNPIVNDKNQSLEKWLQDWKTRYQDSRKTKGEKAPAETNSWQDNLESSLEELGKLLNITEICDRYLSGINQLIFIPHRDLHLLPLHALFSQEKYTTIYLPSAQIGIDRKNRPATNPTAQLLCIKHPGNDEKNKLLFADVEAPAISLLCNGKLIEDEDATLDRVLPKIPTSGYLHFTCHGIHDFKTPINSALELHSKLLTLEDIFKLQELPSCHLVCLSACETGLTSTKDLLDEFIGLSSSFLAVGATYVVSTLWSVEDISSTLIMVKFYQLLFAEKLTPPTALKKAQDWLRTATCDLLIKWYNKLIPEVSNSRRCRGNLEGLRAQVVKEAEEKGLDYQPYSDYYHWAGFIITGKIPD